MLKAQIYRRIRILRKIIDRLILTDMATSIILKIVKFFILKFVWKTTISKKLLLNNYYDIEIPKKYYNIEEIEGVP